MAATSRPPSRNFRSDNNAGLCPEALAAVVACASGQAGGYGDDDSTAAAVAALRSLFGAETEVYFVATGTAANTLAVAALTEPWQRVLCHTYSHWNEDESGAPERIAQCRTTALTPAGDDPTRLTAADLERAFAGDRVGDVHQVQPGVVTLTNATELGTVYRPAALRALCDAAHRHGYRVHVDGARFANAVARLAEDEPGSGRDIAALCRALTVDAGVDALTFGGTKNGLALGEAVLLFPQTGTPGVERAARRLPFLRKSTGHLLSKHRYVTAPFAAVLGAGGDGGAGETPPWLVHAGRANALADRLARGVAQLGLGPRFPCEANAVFVQLPAPVDAALQERGYGYYPFASPVGTVSRLMCSFASDESDVDGLLSTLTELVE